MQKYTTPTSNTHQMTVKERLTLFAKFKEKSVRAFEIKSNLTVGYVNAIRVSIQPDKIQRIASQYPDLNTEWLITGNGPMLKNLPENEVSEAGFTYRTDVTHSASHVEIIEPGDINAMYKMLLKEKELRIQELEKRISDKEEIIRLLQSGETDAKTPKDAGCADVG